MAKNQDPPPRKKTAAKGKRAGASVADRASSRRGSGPGLACVVLAAGQGTRMRSAHAKVLHQILGRPLIAYPIAQALALGADPIVAVLGHQRPAVEAAVLERFGAGAVRVAEQTERLGTGHAVRMSLPALKDAQGILLVLYGDVPLLRRETLSALVGTARRYKCLALMTATPPDPGGYGRVVRDRRGHVLRVVEQKDATVEELEIAEVNAGIYAGPIEFFRKAVPRLAARNAAGEYYLTDIVASAAASIGVSTIESDHRDVSGINDRHQLAQAEVVLRDRINARWMSHATFRDPATIVVEPDVEVGVDADIGRGAALRGRTRIGRGAHIGEGSQLADVEVGAGAQVRPYTVASEAVIGAGAKVGPFAHLRPGTVLGPDVHVGNFVETKKATLGRGSKANHLSYLGDATIGEQVNVGAGTITCNYDGYEKSQTIIEDGAFIGSDTQLVAPVKVGRRAIVAAGTTVTKDVPPGALAIARVAQAIVPGYRGRVEERQSVRRLRRE
jgi:bifunctional UDP-N-acetylglucosamine pyrophosphorylase/glucosamine-1-phosphate N-acetyltransferase